MHGYIFYQLKYFIKEVEGREIWNEVTEKAFGKDELFLASQAYEDEKLFKIVGTLVEEYGYDLNDTLFRFGEYLAPKLLSSYKAFVKSSWRAADLIDNTEDVIHKAVRVRMKGATPPELRTERPSPDTVLITYTSSRKLCRVLRGIATGVAKHYGQKASFKEHLCMLDGASECKIEIHIEG